MVFVVVIFKIEVAQTQCPSTSRRPSLKKSVSSLIYNHALLKSFVQLGDNGIYSTTPSSTQETEPSGRPTASYPSDRRPIYGSGSANRKGPAATRRSLHILLHTLFSVNSQMQSQAASETHVALFRPFWKRKPFLIFVFRIWSRRMFMWSQ